MKHYSIILVLLLSTDFLFGQGKIANIAYSNNYGYNDKNYNSNATVISVNDSSLVLSAKILLNTYADEFILTFGLDKTANLPRTANNEIDNQINKFKAVLVQESIASEDLYVDFISQTKVYDFKLAGNKATQFLVGFEVKKNLVIRLKDVNKFDKVFALASDLGITDLIRVNYIVKDKQEIYNKLLKEAVAVIDNKKRQFTSLSLVKSLTDSIPFIENFYFIYPEDNYRSFQAFETSTIESEVDIIKKELNKKTTFYFEGVNISTFDKVINESTPKKGIQCVYELKIKYFLR